MVVYAELGEVGQIRKHTWRQAHAVYSGADDSTSVIMRKGQVCCKIAARIYTEDQVAKYLRSSHDIGVTLVTARTASALLIGLNEEKMASPIRQVLRGVVACILRTQSQVSFSPSLYPLTMTTTFLVQHACSAELESIGNGMCTLIAGENKWPSQSILQKRID